MIAVTQEPSAVSAVSTATVVASVVVVVASVVVVVASVVVVVASVVVVVASVVVVVASVVASVVVVVASVTVVVASVVVSTDFSVVASVETVGIVSIVFLPKNALIPDVLSNTQRIPMARTMMTRNVMRPARPGSFADLGSFTFFLDFLTVVTGEMVLS